MKGCGIVVARVSQHGQRLGALAQMVKRVLDFRGDFTAMGVVIPRASALSLQRVVLSTVLAARMPGSSAPEVLEVVCYVCGASAVFGSLWRDMLRVILRQQPGERGGHVDAAQHLLRQATRPPISCPVWASCAVGVARDASRGRWRSSLSVHARSGNTSRQWRGEKSRQRWIPKALQREVRLERDPCPGKASNQSTSADVLTHALPGPHVSWSLSLRQ